MAPPYFTNVASRGEERQQAWIFGEKQVYAYKGLSLSLGLCERHGGVPGNPEGTIVHGVWRGGCKSPDPVGCWARCDYPVWLRAQISSSYRDGTLADLCAVFRLSRMKAQMVSFPFRTCVWGVDGACGRKVNNGLIERCLE